jgi:hypothetical protein
VPPVGKAAWKILKALQTALLALGGLMLLFGATPARVIGGIIVVGMFFVYVAAGSRRPRKRCPQCSENVIATALVCKHCKYTFTSEAQTDNV